MDRLGYQEQGRFGWVRYGGVRESSVGQGMPGRYMGKHNVGRVGCKQGSVNCELGQAQGSLKQGAHFTETAFQPTDLGSLNVRVS